MKEHSFDTATITTIGMFTAVLAVLSILQIPMPSGVPITLQTFAVAPVSYTHLDVYKRQVFVLYFRCLYKKIKSAIEC